MEAKARLQNHSKMLMQIVIVNPQFIAEKDFELFKEVFADYRNSMGAHYSSDDMPEGGKNLNDWFIELETEYKEELVQEFERTLMIKPSWEKVQRILQINDESTKYRSMYDM